MEDHESSLVSVVGRTAMERRASLVSVPEAWERRVDELLRAESHDAPAALPESRPPPLLPLLLLFLDGRDAADRF